MLDTYQSQLDTRRQLHHGSAPELGKWRDGVDIRDKRQCWASSRLGRMFDVRWHSERE